MSPLLTLLAVLSLALPQIATPVAGRLTDARSGAPIAGAEITIVGQSGSVRTDDAGRFQWAIPPLLPIDVIAILRDGSVARPIRITDFDAAKEIALAIDPAVRDLELRQAQRLTQALDVVPGVSAISEGQAAEPAIRGLARGRTLILVDGGRASTERRAGANASFLDPAIVHSIEVSRGPRSVAYGSDAFGGVIAARTRAPDDTAAMRVRFAGTAGWGVPQRRGDLEISKGYGTGGVLVGVRARDFDDYAAPTGVITNSGWRDHGVRVRWQHLTDYGLWSIGWQSDFGRSLGRPRSDSDVVLATSPFENSTRVTASSARGSLSAFAAAPN